MEILRPHLQRYWQEIVGAVLAVIVAAVTALWQPHLLQAVLNAILTNVTDNDFQIEKGQKVAQLVMTQVLLPEFVPEEDMPAQDERGSGGFGSTGKSI